jgi:hypothetical protein
MCETHPDLALRCIAVERSGTLVGGTPVMVERRAGIEWIHALPYTLPGAPLAQAGAHAEVDAAVAEAITRLQRELAAVGGEWILYRPRPPEVERSAYERPSGSTRMLETSLIGLENGIEEAWLRLDRDTRYELRRARRLGLRVDEEPSVLEEAYALYSSQVLQRRRRPLALEFSRRLLRAPARDSGSGPAGRLFAVRDARGLLGASLFLDHDRETLAWWSGSRATARAQHAMRFLYWSVAEWAAANGRLRLNLGGSLGLHEVASFKRSIGARRLHYPVRWLDARHGSRLGRWAAATQEYLRRRRFRGTIE